MNPNIAIVYNGGAYGTYLHWVLDTLTQNVPVESPFTNVGNSHLFNGPACDCMDLYRQRVQDHTDYNIIRLHPKTLKTESLTDSLNFVSNTSNKVLYLYPDSESVLLVINNYMSKIWTDWWTNQFIDQISKEKIYKNWPVSPDTPIEKIPVWIKREFLSFYLLPAWYNQVEWFHLDHYTPKNNCQVIFVKDLLYNFEFTIEKTSNFLGVNFTKPISVLKDLHEVNLSLQQHKTQDKLCQNIINSVISRKYLSWQDQELPLASQAYVQWQLRNNGFEIRCDGLDSFPNNSVQLADLLYQSIA